MKMTLQGLPKANNGLYIGVLSGTSMNSIDAILINFIDNIRYKIIASVGYKFKDSLFKQLITIINSRAITIENLGIIDHKLGLEFSRCVQKLLKAAKKYNVTAQDVIAIGCHGQTIWHAPLGKYPFTMQIGDPNLICALNNIVTVADFRRKDLALGGQGAPLATAFHANIFSSKIKNRAIINIGGISNITVLPKNNQHNKVIGFDLGPGNCLMDELVQTKFKQVKIKYDKDGLLASKGQVIPGLLAICLQDPYFKQLPPKSTGREYFNKDWLANKVQLAKLRKPYKNQDLLATLLWLTATVISDQVNNICFGGNVKQKIEEVYLCGGGAKNKALLSLIQQKVTCFVGTTTDLGINPELVEGALFAWLAKQTITGQVGNMPSTTGASKQAILGAIYLP